VAFDETLARRIRKVLDGRKDLVEKHMFGGVCFMIRGRMCCGISDSSLMVRLDPDEADRLADRPHVRPMDFTGKPMRGYLFVDAEGIDSPKALRSWVDRSVAYIETMPIQKKSKAAMPRRAVKRR
jgi:TfoX/Sxy family transcriptional regulator of competence genes